MKFRLNLDESLFDETAIMTPDTVTVVPDVDDDFEYDEHSTEDVLPGPASGSDTGVANELIMLINDEWEAIQGYNGAIANLRAMIDQNPFYANAISVLEEISAEENRHVGQLQEILKNISPNAQDIDKGHEEAQDQLRFVGGKLPVQSWETSTANTNPNAQEVDTTCTLMDIDDEM